MPDHNYFSNLIWQIADLLRGPYRPQNWQTLSAASLPALPADGEVKTIFKAHLGALGPIDPVAKEISC